MTKASLTDDERRVWEAMTDCVTCVACRRTIGRRPSWTAITGVSAAEQQIAWICETCFEPRFRRAFSRDTSGGYPFYYHMIPWEFIQEDRRPRKSSLTTK